MLFIEAIEGKNIPITPQNCSELLKLCDEFQFLVLQDKINSFRNTISNEFSGEDSICLLTSLEGNVLKQSRTLASLETELQRIISEGAVTFDRFGEKLDTLETQLMQTIQEEADGVREELHTNLLFEIKKSERKISDLETELQQTISQSAVKFDRFGETIGTLETNLMKTIQEEVHTVSESLQNTLSFEIEKSERKISELETELQRNIS
jgi:exonuclease VII large subunit